MTETMQTLQAMPAAGKQADTGIDTPANMGAESGWIHDWDSTSPARLADEEMHAFISNCDQHTPAVRLLLLVEKLMTGSASFPLQKNPYPNMFFQDGMNGYAGLVDEGASSRQRRNMLALAGDIQNSRLSSSPGGTLLELLENHPEQAVSEKLDTYRPEDDRIAMTGPLPAMTALGLRNPQWAESMIRVVKDMCAWSANHPPEHSIGSVPAILADDPDGRPIPVESISMVAAMIDTAFNLGPYAPMMSADTATMSMIAGEALSDIRRPCPQRMPARERMMDILTQILHIRAGAGPLSADGCKWRNTFKHWQWAERKALYALATHPLLLSEPDRAVRDVVAAMDAIIEDISHSGNTPRLDLASWDTLRRLATLPWDMTVFLTAGSAAFDFTGGSEDHTGGGHYERTAGLEDALVGIDWDDTDEDGVMAIARRIFHDSFASTRDPLMLLDNDGHGYYTDEDADEREPMFTQFMLGCLETGNSRMAADMSLLDRIICGVCERMAENGTAGAESKDPIPVVFTGRQLRRMVGQIINDRDPESFVCMFESEECVGNIIRLGGQDGSHARRIRENGRYGLPMRAWKIPEARYGRSVMFHVGVDWGREDS